MNKIECFNIRLLIGNSTQSFKDLTDFKVLKDLKCIPNPWEIEPENILADPFLFTQDNCLYLFYESKALYSSAEIKMISSYDLINWSKPITVLKENHHLSFPWVFCYNGDIYMLPETSESNSIRIYKATDKTLTRFTLYKEILCLSQIKEICNFKLFDILNPFCDSCIQEKDGKYYLWTTLTYGGSYHLHLFYSDSIFGPYYHHPKSPVSNDMRFARNAGAIIEEDGILYRVAQDCKESYGNNVSIIRINEISKTSYYEEVIHKNVIPIKQSFYSGGGHQLHVVNFQNKKILATDAKTYKYLFIYRILSKLIKK